MIELEGRILEGLDEFMLRTGHLTTLSRVAHETGPSWRHINRQMAAVFAKEVIVDESANGEIAVYLAEKELCREVGASDEQKRVSAEFRYPNLEVFATQVGDLAVRSLIPGKEIRVQWQDRNLAVRRVPSRVGAITWTGRAGSKTGLSHIADWGQLLELINNSGQLSPNGRLMIALSESIGTPYEQWNPYLVKLERIFCAFEYFRKDLDLFARLAPKLVEERGPLTKSVCRELFVAALKEAARDAERSKSIAPRQRFELNQQLRDLEKSARKAERNARKTNGKTNKAKIDVEDTSTAWHRTASRVETLTDFGLLEKGKGNDKEKYQYVYYPTSSLKRAVETLKESSSADVWLYRHLVEVIFASEQPTLRHVLRIDGLLDDLSTVIKALSLPTSLLPISCLALGIVYLHARRGMMVSLQQVREALEGLPLSKPDIARLARGRGGTHAEFLSVNLRKIVGQ